MPIFGIEMVGRFSWTGFGSLFLRFPRQALQRSKVKASKGALSFLLFFVSLGVFGQQNFFNVPSSDITEPNKAFFQQQFNLFSGSFVSNSTFCYGMGNEWELGLNFLGLTYDTQKDIFVSSKAKEIPVFPSFGLNAQKQLWQHESYSLSVGGQACLAQNLNRVEVYGYLNQKWTRDRWKGILGIFAGNNPYFGKETRFIKDLRSLGFQLGVEYQIVPEKVYLQGDFMSGETPLSNTILGLAYRFVPHWFVSSGYQLPNRRKTSAQGLIFELTWVP